MTKFNHIHGDASLELRIILRRETPMKLHKMNNRLNSRQLSSAASKIRAGLSRAWTPGPNGLQSPVRRGSSRWRLLGVAGGGEHFDRMAV